LEQFVCLVCGERSRGRFGGPGLRRGGEFGGGGAVEAALLGEADLAAVGHDDSRLGPIGMVSGEAVRRGAGGQFQLLRARQVHRAGRGFVARVEDLRAEPLLAVDSYREDHRPAGLAGGVVQVGADEARECLAAGPEFDEDLASGGM